MPYQLIYSSQATAPMSAASLEEILNDARTGNQSRDITGALVYVDGVFLQMIEGEKDAVLALMSGIAHDSRHSSVTVFYEAEVETRAFPSWSMAYLSPTPDEMSAWAGLQGSDTIDNLLAHIHHDTNLVPKFLVSIVEALAE